MFFKKKQPGPQQFSPGFRFALFNGPPWVTPRFTSRSKEGKERFGTDRRPFHKCSNSVDLGVWESWESWFDDVFWLIFSSFYFTLKEIREVFQVKHVHVSAYHLWPVFFWRYSHGCAFSGVFWYNPLKTNIVHLKSTKLKSGKSSEPNLYFGAPC